MIVNQVLSNPQFWLFFSALTALIVAVTAKLQASNTATTTDLHTQQLNGSLDTRMATMISAAFGIAQSGHVPTPNDLTGSTVVQQPTSVIPPVIVPQQVKQGDVKNG